MNLTKDNIQTQNSNSYYPFLEISLDDVVHADGVFCDQQERREATCKIQFDRIKQVRDEILQDQEKIERLQLFIEHLHGLSLNGKLDEQAQQILIQLGNWVSHGDEKLCPDEIRHRLEIKKQKGSILDYKSPTRGEK